MKTDRRKTRMVERYRAAQVTFTMEHELKAKLYARCKALDLAVSRYLRRLITFDLEHPEIGATNVRPKQNYEEKN